MARLFKILVISKQHVRFLPRFSQTRLTVDPLVSSELQPNLQQNPKPNVTEHESLVITSKKSSATSRNKGFQSETNKLQLLDSHIESRRTIDKAGNVIYTKIQNNDPRIFKIIANLKTQQKSKLILLEGKRLIKEALERGCQMEYLLFSRMSEVEYLKDSLPEVGKIYKMPYKEMQMWSELTTSPGIMGIFHIPDMSAYEPKHSLPLTIICDNIREPNNLGAILRISNAVGCEKVILTKGCVNLWDTKVLRSACGAHFHTKLCKDAQWSEISSSLPEKVNVFLADNNLLMSSDNAGDSTKNLIDVIPVLPYFTVDFSRLTKVVLVIGGETEGLSTESYQLAKEYNGARLNIPLSNSVDSLNSSIALGIIAFEIKRQLNKVKV